MTDYHSPTVVWPGIPLNGITPLELAVLTDARIGKMWWIRDRQVLDLVGSKPPLTGDKAS